MVAPAVIAAGISAGSSLLGGLLNRSENRRRERRADPANVRKRFEAAGFNPLLGLGAMNAPVQYGPTMGDAVANAGSLAMSAYNQTHQLEMQRAELEMANQRLTELAEQARLRPTYPGPYQRGSNANIGNSGRSTDPAPGSGGGDRGTSRLDGDPLTGSPGDTRDDLEPQRELDVSPYISNPSVHEMTIPGFGSPLVMPGPEEVPGIDEVLVAAPVALPQIIYRAMRQGLPDFVEHVRDSQPYRQMLNDRVQREREASRLSVNDEIRDMIDADNEWLRRRQGVYTGQNGAGGSW